MGQGKVTAIAGALVLAGCQAPGFVEPAPQLTRAAREAELNLQWREHRYSELLAARGRPLWMLEIPGGGNPPGFVVVYPKDSASGCVDAFALLYGPDPVIRLYQCR